MDVSSALSTVYQDHPELLPTSPDSRNWIAVSIVKLLAGYRYESYIYTILAPG